MAVGDPHPRDSVEVVFHSPIAYGYEVGVICLECKIATIGTGPHSADAALDATARLYRFSCTNGGPIVPVEVS